MFCLSPGVVPFLGAPPLKDIVILGAGALGGLLGACLARGGARVTLCLRRPSEGWPNVKGTPILRVTGVQEFQIPVNLARPGAHLSPPDLLLVATKAYDASAALRSALKAGLVGAKTWVLLLSNGLGLEAEVWGQLPSEQALRGVVYSGALSEGPGCVRWTGEGPIQVGAWPPQDDTEEKRKGVRLSASLFRSAGFPVEEVPDMGRAVWQKALVNLAINPVGALARVRNGVVGTHKALRDLWVSLLREGCRLASSEGFAIPLEEVVRQVEETAEKTAENENSMLQDLRLGRRTEVDYLNGYVAKRGEAPHNAAIASLVRVLQGFFLDTRGVAK